MKKIQESAVSLILCLVMALTLIPATIPSASAVNHLSVITQNQAVYQKDEYNFNGTLYRCGCGIFSLTNAVGYLTGKRMDVAAVAKWAYENKAYNVNKNEGTRREVLFHNAVTEYGGTYGFTGRTEKENDSYGTYGNSSNSTLINHLKKGGVAIGHVPSHFIALVGYDTKSSKFHVYDSYPTSGRGTGNGDCWKTVQELKTGKMCLDWFYLISVAPVQNKKNTTQSQDTTPKDAFVSNGKYRIATALNQNLVVDVSGNNSSNCTNIQVYTSNNTNAQKFTIEKLSSGWYIIKQTSTGKVLDVANGSKNSGTNVWLYTYNGTDAQLWKFKSAPSGGYYIQNKLGCYLDVCNGVSKSGTNVWVYKLNKTQAQVWYLTPINGTFPRCSSSCKTITAGLQNIRVDSSYSYRKKIAAANGISNYSGIASQNNIMLAKLKAGSLVKP